MPRAYTDAERETIITALRQAAMSCMKAYGVRKTTVDELVRRANIPKGTFYLFYPSKESLLFDAIQQMHDDMQNELLNALESHRQNLTPQLVTELICQLYHTADRLGFAALMAHGDFELIMRGLPAEEVASHHHKDALAMDQLIQLLPGSNPETLPAFEGAFRTIFLSLMFKREIGEDYFDQSLHLLVSGLVSQLLG